MSPRAASRETRSLVGWAVASRPHPGEYVSGDRGVVQPFPEGVLLAVLDGIGHGAQAAEASRIAAEYLERHAHESVISIVNGCHEVLSGTRGTALTVASLNALNDTLTWLSVGNVEGQLLRARAAPRGAKDSTLLRGGIVGSQLPPLKEAVLPVSPGDLLVFATDGVAHGFEEGLAPGDPPQKLADEILRRHCKGTDDALVLVARYLGSPR